MHDELCRFGAQAGADDIASALSTARCYRCSVSLSELQSVGLALEICGEELFSDPATGESFVATIALCPACHEENHLDARMQYNPCSLKARRSREGLG